MIRLRQIALVGTDLSKAEADIRAVLGLDYAYDDPGVGKYGLHNAVFPIGNTFLEVVSPTTEGTTAGRLLDKRGGDGGYMVILQTDDLAGARHRALDVGVRIADQRDGDGFAFTHLHPNDTGGAMISIDYMDPWERWEWGGPVWKENLRTDTSLGIVAAEVQADDPPTMAARWAETLGLPVETKGGVPSIALDEGSIRFVPVIDGRGEGLGGIDVAVRDPDKVRSCAIARGVLGPYGEIILAGTRIGLAA